MRNFILPKYYKSDLITTIKSIRNTQEKRNNFSPTKFKIGKLTFFIPRYFGFCFGVKNAIEICYKVINENPKKTIYLLSEMIHNPNVNKDLEENGVKFIKDEKGNTIIPWEDIKKNDIVIIPAFGTTVENLQILKDKGIRTEKFDTTCPFVTKVWTKSDQLSSKNHTVIIHGKPEHEETKSTFSHAKKNGPTIIIKSIDEARKLSKYILENSKHNFYEEFKNRFSENFDPNKDLKKIGVVNQTTMLAEETKEITQFLENIMKKKYGDKYYKNHIANTRDTLCYATNENQLSTHEVAKINADLALIVGGYNSSNTSQLVKICERRFPTFFISSEKKIITKKNIIHYSIDKQKEIQTTNYLPKTKNINIILGSGASCPDSVLERVLEKICSFYNQKIDKDKIINSYKK